MNTNLWSFPLCQCPFSTTLHGVFPFHVGWLPSFLQYLDGSFQWSQTLQKQASEKHPPNRILMIWFRSYFVYLLEIFLNIFGNQRKEDSLGQHFFFAIRMPLHLPLELNSRSFFHLYRSEPLFYSRCAPFRAWKRSQARPKSAENRSPLLCRFEYLQRNNVGQMLWKRAPCSVHCKPDQEMCSVKLCTQQMAMSSQWDKCHKIDMNSIKSNSYFWRLVGPAPEGTRSMQRSWWW